MVQPLGLNKRLQDQLEFFQDDVLQLLRHHNALALHDEEVCQLEKQVEAKRNDHFLQFGVRELQVGRLGVCRDVVLDLVVELFGHVLRVVLEVLEAGVDEIDELADEVKGRSLVQGQQVGRNEVGQNGEHLQLVLGHQQIRLNLRGSVVPN